MRRKTRMQRFSDVMRSLWQELKEMTPEEQREFAELTTAVTQALKQMEIDVAAEEAWYRANPDGDSE